MPEVSWSAVGRVVDVPLIMREVHTFEGQIPDHSVDQLFMVVFGKGQVNLAQDGAHHHHCLVGNENIRDRPPGQQTVVLTAHIL